MGREGRGVRGREKEMDTRGENRVQSIEEK